MGRTLLRALLGVVVAAGVLAAPVHAEPLTGTGDVERLLDGYVTSGQLPGVIIEVTTPAGSWSSARGLADTADGTPMSVGLQHRIGSVTKTFTTTVILQLVQDGRLSLNDTVDRYVPGVPDGDRITLRMLGDMTSGLRDYLANEELDAALVTDPQRVWTAQELLAASYVLGPQFAPGTDYAYSSANTVLLGLVVEAVTGQPFAHVLAERILVPQGLSHTIYPAGNHFSEDHSFGYTTEVPGQDLVDATYWSPSYGNAAGQMISTVGDLTRWTRLVGSGALLSPQVHAERLRWQPVGANDDSWHYAFGFSSFGGWLGHTGEIYGYQTAAVYHPGLDSSIVLAINTDRDIDGEAGVHLLLRDFSATLFPDSPAVVPGGR